MDGYDDDGRYNNRQYDNRHGYIRRMRRLCAWSWGAFFWILVLIAEAVLLLFFYLWGLWHKTDHMAPLLSIYPTNNSRGFVMTIVPLQICVKWDNTWKDTGVPSYCKTLTQDARQIEDYFSTTYGPLIGAKATDVSSGSPLSGSYPYIAAAKVESLSWEKANIFWPVRLLWIIFVVAWLWLLVTVVVFYLGKAKRTHRSQRKNRSYGCCGNAAIDIWFIMWFLPVTLLWTYWIITLALWSVLNDIKQGIESDPFLAYYYQANYTPTAFIPMIGTVFSFLVFFFAFLTWLYGYHKLQDGYRRIQNSQN